MSYIDRKARELLAAEYEADGCMQLARMIRAGAVTDPDFGSVKIMRAMRAIIAALTPPERPDPALLVSMAMRINHGFGLMDRMAQNSLLADMSKVWEEVVGKGYYSPENASRYLRELARADARPEVK